VRLHEAARDGEAETGAGAVVVAGPQAVVGLEDAPPLGLGLYGACLIGNVPIEQTIKPILGYLGLLLLCLLVIAFVPSISTALPRAFGY